MLCFLCATSLFAASVSAKKATTNIKLVFPFGLARPGTASQCPTKYSTENGCCSSPNQIAYYNTRKICCNDCSDGATRYGQTNAEPCGQCCRSDKQVDWFNGNQVCCSGCNGIRYERTEQNKCGQCCDATTNAISSYGGSQSCCPSMPANHHLMGQTTANICGSFCSASNYASFGGKVSCCTTTCKSRMLQTTDDVCGTCCSDEYAYISNYNYNNNWNYMLSGCCVNDASSQALPFDVGTICCFPGDTAFTYSSRDTTMIYHKVGCCENVPQSIPNIGTYCCSSNSYAYGYVQTSYSSPLGPTKIDVLSIGCCPYSVQSITNNSGTACCSPAEKPYLGPMIDYNFTAVYSDNQTVYFPVFNAQCCPFSIQRLSDPLGDVCCSNDRSAFYYKSSEFLTISNENAVTWKAGCCLSGKTPLSIPDGQGTFCCSESNANPYVSLPSRFIDFDKNGNSVKTQRIYYPRCCSSSYFSYSLPYDLGGICCNTGSAFVYRGTDTINEDGGYNRTFGAECCSSANSSVYTLPGHSDQICCAKASSQFAFWSFYNSSERKITYSKSCCSTNLSAISFPTGNGTFCCSQTATPFFGIDLQSKSFLFQQLDGSFSNPTTGGSATCCQTGNSIVSTSFGIDACCPPGGSVTAVYNDYYGRECDINNWSECSRVRLNLSCCTNPTSLVSGMGTHCCPTGQSAYGWKVESNMSFGCCAATSAVKTLTSDKGTMCCPTAAPSAYCTSTTCACCNYSVVSLPYNLGETCCSSTSAYPYAAISIARTYRETNISESLYWTGCCTQGNLQSLPSGLGTICCPPANKVFAVESYTMANDAAGYDDILYSTGCCATGTSFASISYSAEYGRKGTAGSCCSGQYERYMTTYSSINNAITFSFYSGCCPTGTISFQLPEYQTISYGNAVVCCSPTQKPYMTETNYSVDTYGGVRNRSLSYGCCNNGSYHHIKQSVPQGAAYGHAYSGGCCPTGTTEKTIEQGTGTFCCSTGQKPYVTDISYNIGNGMLYGKTYSYGCCANGTYYFKAISFSNNNLYSGHIYSGGCCATGTQEIDMGNGETYCCSTGTSPYVFQDITSYTFEGNINIVSRSVSCCSSAQSLLPGWGQHCCPGTQKAFGYIAVALYSGNGVALNSMERQIGCCTAGQTPQSLVSGLGTYCCPDGKSPAVTFSFSSMTGNFNLSYYDRYTQISCQ